MDEIRALGQRRRAPIFAALFLLAAGLGALFVLSQDGVLPGRVATATDAGAQPEIVDNSVKASLLVSTGRVALEKGDLDNARIMADAALDIAPEDASGHLLRGAVLLKGNALEDAADEVTHLRTLTNLSPADQQELSKLAAELDAKQRARTEVADTADRDKRDRDKRERDRGTPPSRLAKGTLESVTSITTTTFQRCYEDEVLKKHPKAEGEVEISARVSPSGKVDTVTLKVPAKLQRGAFVGCVREATLRWRFPKWQGSPENYRHKIYFRPS